MTTIHSTRIGLHRFPLFDRHLQYLFTANLLCHQQPQLHLPSPNIKRTTVKTMKRRMTYTHTHLQEDLLTSHEHPWTDLHLLYLHKLPHHRAERLPRRHNTLSSTPHHQVKEPQGDHQWSKTAT
jgi:hypothetical protein